MAHIGGGGHAHERLGDGEHRAAVAPLARAGTAAPAGAGRHLPSFWSTFVGRSRELNEIGTLLASARLVTLTGPGGIGKTRLAATVAGAWHPAPSYWVDLAPLGEPNLVGERVAAAFGVGELRDRNLAEVVAPQLSGEALLVLDNCEHVIEACAVLVRGLLARCRDLRIVTTSQQRLGVSGEVVWPVPPLEVPEAGTDAAPEEALHAAAVRLFCERAAAAKAGFVPSVANIAAIVEICRRLDANPLAIELAAARVEALSPAEIAARLESRFQLLHRGAGTSEGRHETLAAALQWSHELLREPERILLRRLSVFAGGFDLDAVEAVCVGGDVEASGVIDLLAAIVAKSLVVADTSGARARYRLLETVRHYAADALGAATEATDLQDRHARWCVRLVEEANEADDPGPALQALELERDNVRAALEWCVSRRRGELALRLACGQMLGWEASGRFAEAREWFGRALAVSTSAPASLRARALYNAGFAALVLGELEPARRDVGASLELSVAAGDPPPVVERTQGLLAVVSTFGGGPSSIENLEAELAEARHRGDSRLGERLVGCAHLRLFRGEPIEAQRHFEELRTFARQVGDEGLAATAHVGLGATAIAQGECDQAGAHLRDAVALATTTAQVHTEVLATMWLAELAHLTGDDAGARASLEECLSRARPMGAPYSVARTLVALARVELVHGDTEAARGHFEEASAVSRAASLAHLEAAALEGLGQLALAQGDLPAAQGLFDEVLALAQSSDEKTVTAHATYWLAEADRAEGNLDRALARYHDAVRRSEALGDRPAVAAGLDALAGVGVLRESYEHAARLFGAAEGLRTAGGWVRPWRPRDPYDADVARLRGAMAPEEVETAWGQGRALSLAEAVAYAIRGRGSRARSRKGPDALTPTERDVVKLVAEGLDNSEIGQRLFISPRTVQSHLRRVFAKLGVTSRRELRRALAEGLRVS